MAKKSIVARVTITAGTPKEPVSYPPGERLSLDAAEADRLVALGFASLPEDAPASPAPPPPPPPPGDDKP